MRGRIRNLSQFHISSEIRRYLGFPLTRNRKSRETFSYVIDGVHSKLKTLKANCLSLEGCITFAKSVLSTIPLYPMTVARLPLSICHEVERLQRSLIYLGEH